MCALRIETRVPGKELVDSTLSTSTTARTITYRLRRDECLRVRHNGRRPPNDIWQISRLTRTRGLWLPADDSITVKDISDSSHFMDGPSGNDCEFLVRYIREDVY